RAVAERDFGVVDVFLCRFDVVGGVDEVDRVGVVDLLVRVDGNLVVHSPVDRHVPVAVRHGGHDQRAARQLRVALPRFGSDQAVLPVGIAAAPDDLGFVAAQQLVGPGDVHRGLIAGRRDQLHLAGGQRLDLFGGIVLDDELRVGDAGLTETTVCVIARFFWAADGINDSALRLPGPQAD